MEAKTVEPSSPSQVAAPESQEPAPTRPDASAQDTPSLRPAFEIQLKQWLAEENSTQSSDDNVNKMLSSCVSLEIQQTMREMMYFTVNTSMISIGIASSILQKLMIMRRMMKEQEMMMSGKYRRIQILTQMKTQKMRRIPQWAQNSNLINWLQGRVFGLQTIGTKRIPEHVRSHKQTELERANAMMLLATLPKSLPCKNKEMDEITAFVKGAICDDQCLGRCLYIHGVTGTGKVGDIFLMPLYSWCSLNWQDNELASGDEESKV